MLSDRKIVAEIVLVKTNFNKNYRRQSIRCAKTICSRTTDQIATYDRDEPAGTGPFLAHINMQQL